MDKANAAEWLLRRVVDPVRASELIGDELEAHPAVGMVNFWISITRLLLVFSWRTLIGVAASPVVGLALAFALFVFTNSQSKVAVGLTETTIFHLKNYLLGVSVLLWAATVFSLVRLGWRSTLTNVSLTASVLCSASLSFISQGTPNVVSALLSIVFIVSCASSAKRRRAFGILGSSVAAGWLTAYALSISYRDPYSIFGKWQFFMALVLVPIVESSTTMFLQQKFMD